MKKLLLLSIIALFTMASANVFGQNAGTPINPSIGDVNTYTVNYHSTSTYAWSLQATANGAGSELFGTTVATAAATNSNSVTVTWLNPNAGTVYYLHLTETNGGTCTNRKALAIQPVNNFKLDIANVSASGTILSGGLSTNSTTCAPAIATIAWGETGSVTTTNATNFNYDYGTVVFYYKITASGINFSNTSWTPSIAVAQTFASFATVTIDTQVGATLGTTWTTPGILANNATTSPVISAGAGNNVIWVRVTVKNNVGTPLTANENLSNNDFTFTINSGKDQNNNPATSLGNVTTVQTQLARPDSGAIQY